ncbi:MAG TPA: hypothetical protein VIK01_12285 [Polyangiaceae bacterium]
MAAQAQSEFRRQFHSSFLAFAARVHRRHALRQALTGGGLGLALGALGALGLWAIRLGELRPFAAGLGAFGAAAGALWAGRRRWSDSDVALYLDARLGSHETLTTALGALASNETEEPALSHVVERAASVLGSADPTRVRPQLWSRSHVALPVSAAAIVAVSLLPLPPAPKPPAVAPGAERVRIENLKGLERIEALDHLRGQNPEQDARLKKLAEQARKLRESLAKGLEKREALSEIAKLRDGIAAERLKLGDQQNRPGLDAALRAFGSNKALRDAQKALGNGDLTAFDEEMQKLANRAESTDRQAAKEALEEAAKEAREKGAKGLADALDAERRLFERRQEHADALRELAQSMKGKLSPEAQDDLKEFGRSGNPKAEQRLEQGLERALEGLTPEERKRLAERMQKQLQDEGGAAAPMTKKQLEDLAKSLSTDDGVESLEKQLKELAKPEGSEDSEREQGLGDADHGGSEAERGLGAMPIPMSGDDSPGSGAGKAGSDKSGGKAGGAPGSEHDTGTGDHKGSTPEVAGKELRSKAEARLQAGAAMHGATLGRAPARAGETANQLGTGSLGDKGARQIEVGAVDHADIPEEYREQVGRYFEP